MDRVKQFITCKTLHVDYVRICHCGFFYIDKMIHALHIHFKEYFRSIVTGEGAPRLIKHVGEVHRGDSSV